jgi:hypothetical protein
MKKLGSSMYWLALAVGAIRLILVLGVLIGCSRQSEQAGQSITPSQPATQAKVAALGPKHEPKGNNLEAEDLARAATNLARATWPKAESVWEVELTPERITGDIPSYRRRVTRCKVTIWINSEEWQKATESDQRALIKGYLDSFT